MRHEGPLLQLVDQLYPPGASVDVAAEVARGLRRVGLHTLVTRGARVAITAGSRGIADLPAVLRAAVAAVREAGGDPFVAPCMGSHGGATAAGQRAVLARPRRDGGERRRRGRLVDGRRRPSARAPSACPVWASRDLAEADGVIVVNRVKPHTDFHGEVESGLVKMLVIGAGKHAGALSAHDLTVRHGFPAVLADHGERLLAGLPVLCGIAVVEDQRDRTALVEVLRPDEFFTREPALLERARELLPRLPFAPAGRARRRPSWARTSAAPAWTPTSPAARRSGAAASGRREPRITRIFVRGLTPATHGNACGIGMADFTTARCAAEIDRAATDVNCITSNSPEDARIPIACATDREAVAAAHPDERRARPGRGAPGVGAGHGAPGADRRVRGAAGRGAGRRDAAPRRPALPSALRRERRPEAVAGSPYASLACSRPPASSGSACLRPSAASAGCRTRACPGSTPRRRASPRCAAAGCTWRRGRCAPGRRS